MSAVRPTWLNLVILAVICLQGDVVFGQVFNGLQQHPGITRSANGPHYFTIIGHIGHPNCYELPTSSPSLVSFVEFAGNLNRTAAGSIRIIRNGRMAQSVFYGDGESTERLVSGDILVVDGKINQGRIILRGNQNTSDESDADVTLAITGIRDYPVVITIPAGKSTIRWVTRHLGLDERVVNSVKAITQRQPVQVLPDSRLSTGTILAFDPAMVDSSRLPDDLPVPVKAGRQPVAAPQPIRPTVPIVQQPATGPGNRYGAAPGRARVPTIDANPDRANQAGQTEEVDLTPDEQIFVKQLLTDPSSVPLDEPAPELSGRAFVSQRPTTESPASASAARSANVFQDRPAASAAVGSAVVSDASRQNEQPLPGYASSSVTESALAQPANQPRPNLADFSPEAPRPYASEPATPEPLQPFGSSRNAVDDSASQSEPPAEASPPTTLDNSRSGGSFSLAMQGATLAATAAGISSNQSSTDRSSDQGRDTPPPSPPASSAGGPTPVSPTSPLVPIQPSTASPVRTEVTTPQPESIPTVASSDGSRLLPPPPRHLNWPVISILTVGFLGAVAACFLIYSIAHENPAPRVTQIDTSGRYWLDRMIENDIPIEEEAVNYPHKTQLFGKPAPIQRIDAAHRPVPRPHFSTPGGKSGVLKENPAMPDAPSPEISDAGQKRIVRIHKGGPTRQQAAAAVPAPHTAGTIPERSRPEPGIFDFAATAVFGDTGQGSDAASKTEAPPAPEAPAKPAAVNPARQFRLDTGHQAAETIAHTAAGRSATTTRKPVSVQPSPVVVQGANLLDRILSSVDQGQNAARSKAVTHNHDERPSDERGNS
tara:strand:+ start:35283 stop:37760 length:2478 start_codon:yes stop_codon:yes gene_type:complete